MRLPFLDPFWAFGYSMPRNPFWGTLPFPGSRWVPWCEDKEGLPPVDVWTDPILWALMGVSVVFFYRASRSLVGDLLQRRGQATKEIQMARMLICHYKARYGAKEFTARIDEDLRVVRARVEELGAQWKKCQRLKEEALKEMERRRLTKEERRLYRAFLEEARRLKALKKAQELTKR